MNKIWAVLKSNRDWVLIILGLLLILFAAINLIAGDPDIMLARLNLDNPVDQQGFAPIFVPKPSAGEGAPAVQPESPNIPERIIIEGINLDAPVEVAKSANVKIAGEEVVQFLVPEKFAVGWHEGSAPLGVPGNTILSGHHNAYGKVFQHLIDVKVGDPMTLVSGLKEFNYVIANKMILPEKGEPLDVRLDNGRWILPSQDERVTLVTCWPEDTNSHRLILVAVPMARGAHQTSAASPTPTPGVLRLSTPILSALEAMTPTQTPTLAPAGTPQPGGEAVFPVRNAGRFSVNIRAYPDIQSKIIGSFLKDEQANAIGRTEDGAWIYIVYGDLQGWVDTELVETNSPLDILPERTAGP